MAINKSITQKTSLWRMSIWIDVSGYLLTCSSVDVPACDMNFLKIKYLIHKNMFVEKKNIQFMNSYLKCWTKVDLVIIWIY